MKAKLCPENARHSRSVPTHLCNSSDNQTRDRFRPAGILPCQDCTASGAGYPASIFATALHSRRRPGRRRSNSLTPGWGTPEGAPRPEQAGGSAPTRAGRRERPDQSRPEGAPRPEQAGGSTSTRARRLQQEGLRQAPVPVRTGLVSEQTNSEIVAAAKPTLLEQIARHDALLAAAIGQPGKFLNSNDRPALKAAVQSNIGARVDQAGKAVTPRCGYAGMPFMFLASRLIYFREAPRAAAFSSPCGAPVGSDAGGPRPCPTTWS
jgi:hypothetical protein